MRYYWEGLISVIGLIGLLVAALYFWSVPLATSTEALIISVVTVLFAIVVGRMLTGTINLEFLISEDNGHASLSRFQFLVFTFVIAGGYLLLLSASIGNLTQLIVGGKLTLPEIPNGVLGLIGISGGSYVVSKGIQAANSSTTGAAVKEIKIANPGSGYMANTHIDLTFTGGGGTDAKAYAVVGANGVVTDIVLQSGGSGYTSAPELTLNVSPATNGTVATGKAVLVS